jgi:hypothetical protein
MKIVGTLTLAASCAGCSVMADSKICSTPPPIDGSPQAMADANSKRNDPSYQQTMGLPSGQVT